MQGTCYGSVLRVSVRMGVYEEGSCEYVCPRVRLCICLFVCDSVYVGVCV